jgi:tRNA(Ile)-lysidine synthase TilS/MesJ
MDLELVFDQTISQIFAKNLPNKIAVGVSGGSDSMALTLLLQKFSLSKAMPFISGDPHFINSK